MPERYVLSPNIGSPEERSVLKRRAADLSSRLVAAGICGTTFGRETHVVTMPGVEPPLTIECLMLRMIDDPRRGMRFPLPHEVDVDAVDVEIAASDRHHARAVDTALYVLERAGVSDGRRAELKRRTEDLMIAALHDAIAIHRGDVSFVSVHPSCFWQERKVVFQRVSVHGDVPVVPEDVPTAYLPEVYRVWMHVDGMAVVAEERFHLDHRHVERPEDAVTVMRRMLRMQRAGAFPSIRSRAHR